MDVFNRAYSQLRDSYRSLTPGARLTAWLLAAVAVAALAYLGAPQAARPDTDLMHGAPIANSQLPLMEAAFEKAKLKGYVIQGTSILVPQADQPKYMAALVAANALPPNMGAARREALNGASLMDIGTGRDQQRMRLARLEGLASFIRLLPEIEDANVEYDVEPRSVPFKEKAATAIVCVKMKGSKQLDEPMVLTIRDVVVGYFAGLKPEDVVVADSNGRTWRGPIGTAAENQFRLAKRASEQDLKARIQNALDHIPNVDVQVNVELNREQPISARVLVRVPMSYFASLWQQHNSAEPGKARKTPDQAALDQVRVEESANIQRCVAALLPPPKGGASLAEMVTVTPFMEIPAETPAATVPDDVWKLALQSWQTLAAAGVAMVCLLGLWSIARSKPAKADAAAAPAIAEPIADANRSTAAKVAAPHWHRRTQAVDRPLREELSKLVEDDPEAAANILRKWIGQVS
jgi:flagellar biosynthesis/type III secretory pathway M-ring protein FliF/YscJ